MAYKSKTEEELASSVHINLRLPVGVWRAVKEIAQGHHMSLNATILALIDLGRKKLEEEMRR